MTYKEAAELIETFDCEDLEAQEAYRLAVEALKAKNAILNCARYYKKVIENLNIICIDSMNKIEKSMGHHGGTDEGNL